MFQSFKTSCSKQQLWPALVAMLLWFKWHVTRPKTHAIEACIFKYDVKKKKNRSRNLISVSHSPSKKTTASRPFLIIVLGPLIGLDRYWSITWTVISVQQPRVFFLHVRWQIRRKGSSLAFFSFVFGSFQADLFGLWGSGGFAPSHPPAYAPEMSARLKFWTCVGC